MIALALLAAATVASSPCHTVHGRMDLWNGTPSVRIWIVGTHRVLGVVQNDAGFDALPASVRRIWDGKDPDADWRTAIYGDFKVCAESRYHPGRMQSVTLVDAVHLTARLRR